MKGEKLFAISAFLGTIAAVAVFFVLKKGPDMSPLDSDPLPIHRYNDPDTPADDSNTALGLGKIRIKAFYVTSAGKERAAQEAWPAMKLELHKTLSALTQFHGIQFRNRSMISYDVYPEPIVLEEYNSFNGALFDEQGLDALIPITQEAEKKVFQKDGDLYHMEFSAIDPSEYVVIGFVYEGGVAAAGGAVYESGIEGESLREIAKRYQQSESAIRAAGNISVAKGAFLLGSERLLNEVSGASVFYHEFGHALGLPDGYPRNTPNRLITNDIMGLGRFRPITTNYIDRLLTQHMGLNE